MQQHAARASEPESKAEAPTLALVRLLRLASPALPVGAYGYSQGLETAIRQGWVSGEDDLYAWVRDVLALSLSRLEAVLFCRLYTAWQAEDLDGVWRLNEELLAARETAEFPPVSLTALQSVTTPAFATVFTFAAARWDIGMRPALSGYLFAWAENQASAAVKAGQVGHIAAQRILARIALDLVLLVDGAADLERDELSNFAPALAIASCMHEAEDSRMFRS